MQTGEFQHFAGEGPSPDPPQRRLPLEAPWHRVGDSSEVRKVSAFRRYTDDRTVRADSDVSACAVAVLSRAAPVTLMRSAAVNVPHPAPGTRRSRRSGHSTVSCHVHAVSGAQCRGDAQPGSLSPSGGRASRSPGEQRGPEASPLGAGRVLPAGAGTAAIPQLGPAPRLRQALWSSRGRQVAE